jgi:hypothetical protein
MKKAAWVIVLIILVKFLLIGGDYFSAMRSYDKLRKNAESPILEAVAIGEREEEFLNEVQGFWTPFDMSSIDNPMTKMCELSGFEPNVEGIVAMLTHEIPPFSIFDRDRNIREAGRAGGFSQLKEFAAREKFYWKKGTLYMMIRDDIVEIHEDTDTGVKHLLYYKK